MCTNMKFQKKGENDPPYCTSLDSIKATQLLGMNQTFGSREELRNIRAIGSKEES